MPEASTDGRGVSSFFARLGALALSPRRLARRDLAAADGKASDDFLIFALLAIVLEGATSLQRAALAFASGRRHGGLHQLLEVAKPAAPLLLLWLTAAALFALFTIRSPRRAPGELGARVAQVFVLSSLLISPVANALDAGPLRYTLASLPWATSAMWFGLGLLEALELESASAPLPASTRAAGAAILLACLLGGAIHVGEAFHAQDVEPSVPLTRAGASAPSIDLPLLEGAQRLQLGTLHGRSVLLTFWATWCAPCLAELPELERAYAARGSDAPLVYAINIDEAGPERAALVRTTVQRLGLSFPIALDDGAAAAAYSITSIPTAVRIDERGAVGSVYDRSLDEAELRDLFAH